MLLPHRVNIMALDEAVWITRNILGASEKSWVLGHFVGLEFYFVLCHELNYVLQNLHVETLH